MRALSWSRRSANRRTRRNCKSFFRTRLSMLRCLRSPLPCRRTLLNRKRGSTDASIFSRTYQCIQSTLDGRGAGPAKTHAHTNTHKAQSEKRRLFHCAAHTLYTRPLSGLRSYPSRMQPSSVAPTASSPLPSALATPGISDTTTITAITTIAAAAHHTGRPRRICLISAAKPCIYQT